MSWRKVRVSEFLRERADRYKPDVANKLGLNRIKKIDFSGNIHLTSHKPTRTNMILVKKGDLLISGINAEKGAISVYNFGEDAIATIHYSSYSYDNNKIDIRYLTWFLKSKLFKDILKEQSGNGIKTEIKPKKFLRLEFMLPSLSKQEEIVKKLNIIEREVEQLSYNAQKNDFLISKLRQSILQDAIRGKLTKEWRESNPYTEPASELLKRIKSEKEKLIKEKKIKKEKPLPPISPDEIPYELPDGWEWCRFQDLFSEIRYGTSKKCGYGKDFGDVPVLRIPNIVGGKIEIEDLKVTTMSNKEKTDLSLKRGDLLIIRSNGSTNFVGRSAVVTEKVEGMCYAGYLMRIRLMDKINEDYLNIMLESSYIRRMIELPIRTTSGVKNVNSLEISRLLIALPAYKEQIEIASKVNNLFNFCDYLEEAILESKLETEQLMQGILREAFTPKKDIVEELLPDIDKYMQVAMVTQKMENAFGFNHGKVEKQKTGFILKEVKKQPISYEFEKSHFGTFSWQLSEDLDNNPFLRKIPADKGEVYQIRPEKYTEILDQLNAPKSTPYIQAIDEVIQVYQNPLIAGKTDQIELLNTICKVILDEQTTDLDKIYAVMESWSIKQEGYGTKADKFSKSETEKMLKLVMRLQWHNELII